MVDDNDSLERWADISRVSCRALAAAWGFGVVIGLVARYAFDAKSLDVIWKVTAPVLVLGTLVTGLLWLVGEFRSGLRSSR